jgi:acyl carrier protein
MNPIELIIAAYISKNILFSRDGYPYPNDASFLENGIVDSTNILELIMFVEENYKISVADDEIIPDNFDSVAKMANYVKSKMN